MTIGAAATAVRAGELAWLTRTDALGSSELRLAATGAASRVLLFSGSPLREPVVLAGPFVMNTAAQIQQAFADYRAGRF